MSTTAHKMMESQENVLSESQDNIFDSLSNRNEYLMGEMKEYLAALTQPGPVEDTGDEGSIETKKADNISASSAASSLSSASDKAEAKPEGGGIARGQQYDGTMKTARRRSLNPIGEDEQCDSQVEYYNDYSYEPDSLRHPSCGDSQFDDDSLVDMAKRMDAASIISDPSTICGPNEKSSHLPQPKKLSAGMKKLSQKMNRKQPPPVPKKTAGPVANHSDEPLWRYLNNQKGAIPEHARQGNTGKDGFVCASSVRGEQSPLSGSTSSSKENIDLRAPAPSEMPQKFNPAVTQTEGPFFRRMSSSSKSDSAEGEERRRPARRRSGKKSNRKSSSPSNGHRRSKTERTGERAPDAHHMQAMNTHSGEGSGRRKSANRGGSGRRKSGSKKKQPKNDFDESDQMVGIGFNTRIHDKTMPEGDSNETNQETDMPSKVRHDNMTRLPPKDRSQSPREPVRSSGKQAEGSDNYGDDQTEVFYETVTEDEDSGSERDRGDADSVYDSDDHTQIFYESTDDEFDSDEEADIAGLSVAEAVQNLNKKRTVTKVKNLFGLRG